MANGKPDGRRKNGGRRPGAGRKPQRNPWALTDGERVNLLEYCKSIGYDPVTAMVDTAVDPETSPSMRFAAHREVAKYIHPTLGKIDLKHEGKIGGDLSATSEEELRRRLDELRGGSEEG